MCLIFFLGCDKEINSSFINEFQMINRNEENNSSIKDDSCLVVSRTKMNKTKNSIIKKYSNQ